MLRTSRTLRLLGLLAALVLFTFAASASAFAQDEAAPPAETPPAEPPAETPPAEGGEAKSSGNYGHLAGEWDSEWGRVKLTINGSTVTGTFPDGTIEGSFDAKGVLNYSWKFNDGSDGGKGAFNLDGEKLVGRWGYGVSQNNGGDWSMWRPKK